MLQPSRNENLEAVGEPWRVVREWIEAYNREDTPAQSERAHFPMVNFSGAALSRDVLDVEVREGPRDMPDRPRDPGWSHSVIDRWAVHQYSERKAHVVIDFRRCRANGAPYGVALSRLSVVTKEGGRWGVRAQSSCGLRHPARVHDDRDTSVVAAAERVVRELFEAVNAHDRDAVADLCHDPFVDLTGPDLSVLDDPAERRLGLDGADDSRWARSDPVAFEVLPPQSGDKAIVDLNVRRYAADGTELPATGAVYLVTRMNGEWGLGMSSRREGLDGVP
jgi:ketosteroid isomerase-like protein